MGDVRTADSEQAKLDSERKTVVGELPLKSCTRCSKVGLVVTQGVSMEIVTGVRTLREVGWGRELDSV